MFSWKRNTKLVLYQEVFGFFWLFFVVFFFFCAFGLSSWNHWKDSNSNSKEFGWRNTGCQSHTHTHSGWVRDTHSPWCGGTEINSIPDSCLVFEQQRQRVVATGPEETRTALNRDSVLIQLDCLLEETLSLRPRWRRSPPPDTRVLDRSSV